MDYEIVNINSWNIKYVLEIGNLYSEIVIIKNKNTSDVLQVWTNKFNNSYEFYDGLKIVNLLINYLYFKEFNETTIINFINKYKNFILLYGNDYYEYLKNNLLELNYNYDNYENEITCLNYERIILFLDRNMVNDKIISDIIRCEEILCKNYKCHCDCNYTLLLYYNYLIGKRKGKRKNICDCINNNF